MSDPRLSQPLLLLRLHPKLEHLRPFPSPYEALLPRETRELGLTYLLPLSRVPTALKNADTLSKAATTQGKPIDSWALLPVPMSSSRSFSELMKSEEHLSSKVSQLQVLVEQQQQSLSAKDCEIRALKAEVASGQEMIAKTHRSLESKSESLLAQQHEKYQDLNERYLELLSRARLCESKLEELLIDPLTLQPFKSRVSVQAEAENTLQRHRTILTIIEEHQNKEDTHILELQQETANILRRAVEELAPPSSSAAADLIASARHRSSRFTEQQLRQVEMSIPTLILDDHAAHDDDNNEDDETSATSDRDLDWSINTTDESISPPPSEDIEQMTYYAELPPSMRPTEPHPPTPGLDESNFDDDFFNESISETD